MTQPDDFRWAMRLLARRFRPRARLTVSEWADAYRVLSGKASAEAGQWRTARTPYLREILDCLSDDSLVQRVVVMKSAQVGMTEAAVNWIGYVMDHVATAKPMLVVLPSDDLRKRWVHQRLRPMCQLAAPLRRLIDVSKSRDGTNTLELLDYPGGLLYLTSAGSAARLKSDSIRFVICDETDEFGWDVGGKGDPLGLIQSRTANFPRRKLFLLSTPTNKGASRIEGEWERSDQRHYQVACPHCGEFQALTWEHLQWSEDIARTWYVCAHNGCMIEERDKPGMLASGRWVPSAESRTRGYHINALYSPIGLGFSWTELVAQWFNAQADAERLKQFVNERLGLPYEDARTAIRTHSLHERAEDYRLREVPPGCALLTAGVDTQDNRLAMQIIGWGPGIGKRLRWWVLDYVELPGSPSREETWVALAELLNAPLETAAGAPLHISVTAIDMAGHHTEDVKAFWRRRQLHHPLMLVVGDNVRRQSVLEGRARKTDHTWRGQVHKGGCEYWRVNTGKAKDALFAALREDEEAGLEERQTHFSRALDPDYFHQLLSEVWDPKKNRYIEKRGHRHHEVLDTWVYALAAAHHPHVRVHQIGRGKWSELLARLAPRQDAAPTPTKPAHEPERRPAAAPWIDAPIDWINRRR